MLTDLAFGELLEELAAPHAAPGGGSALAAALAAAAAVVQMAARLSAPWPESGGAAAQAQALRERAAELVQVDADLYARALAAAGTVAGLPEERRDRQLGRIIAEAAEPPLALCRLAADVAELARTVAEYGAPQHRPDAVAAAALAAAVADGARGLVAANLTALPGDGRIAEAGRHAAAAAEAAAAATR